MGRDVYSVGAPRVRERKESWYLNQAKRAGQVGVPPPPPRQPATLSLSLSPSLDPCLCIRVRAAYIRASGPRFLLSRAPAYTHSPSRGPRWGEAHSLSLSFSLAI